MQRKEFSLKEIAQLTGSILVGNPEVLIAHVSDLENAGPNDASFLSNCRYEHAMKISKAGVIFVQDNTFVNTDSNFLINENPSRAFQQLIELFHGKNLKLTAFENVHPSAIIHEGATLGKNIQVGPLAVIDGNVSIGDNARIGAGCIIGLGTLIGKDCILHPRVTIRENCVIGDRVVIQPGAVIGSCGFGFTTDKNGRHTKLNQIGNVVIEDDVEIGANTTIDRARFKSTTIKSGTIIDNLVQIAHGVVIGCQNIIVSQAGIAGSTETGKHVVIAGQVGIAGHLKICDGVMIAAQSGVTKSITKPGKYGGFTAIPLSIFNRNHVHSLKLDKYVKEIKELKN